MTICQAEKFHSRVYGMTFHPGCCCEAEKTVQALPKQHEATAAACGTTDGLTESFQLCEACAEEVEG